MIQRVVTIFREIVAREGTALRVLRVLRAHCIEREIAFLLDARAVRRARTIVS